VRILVVTNLYPPVVQGGYEVECADVVAHLGRKHEVLVLTSGHRRGEAPADEGGVIRKLPSLRHVRRDSFRAPLTTLRAARLTRATVESFGPELVFVWNGSQIPQAALRILADTGIPLAYRICEHWFGRLYEGDRFMRHLVPGERGPRGLWAGLMRAVNRHPALRLDPSRRSRAAISWNSDALRRLTPVPRSVEPALERTIHPVTSMSVRFEGLERRPAERTTIAFVGALKKEKGPHVACRALALLRSRHGIEARLVLAGPVEARMRRELESLASEMGLNGAVEIPGRLGTEALGDLLSRAHALVVPSVWQEPFGLVCLEGALARVPVVASRIGGIPECLSDGEHALLFPPGDADACAAALAETLSDADATGERVARAFQRGRELSLERYLDESERFVAEAMTALTG
jgi:glycosyltransferase involved in cell wall biosynthesis